MSTFLSVEGLANFATLTSLELVLGIDNIVFLTILVSRLPRATQARARRLGLLGAMFTRLGLLLSITWVMQLTNPLFRVLGRALSGRDLILVAGGLFLVAKATKEMHDKVESDEADEKAAASGRETLTGKASFAGTIIQIMLIDIIFSLDSVITAVGMSRQIPVMVAAVVASVGMMMFFAGPIGNFVERHPTMKVLALSFLILIGVFLMLDGLGTHINKGYIYFAMAFALGVEVINLRARRRRAERSVPSTSRTP